MGIGFVVEEQKDIETLDCYVKLEDICRLQFNPMRRPSSSSTSAAVNSYSHLGATSLFE